MIQIYFVTLEIKPNPQTVHPIAVQLSSSLIRVVALVLSIEQFAERSEK